MLDEATSSIDSETEHLLQLATAKLTEAYRHLIAHRLSTIREADQILVIDKGTIAERGTHKNWYAKGPLPQAVRDAVSRAYVKLTRLCDFSVNYPAILIYMKLFYSVWA